MYRRRPSVPLHARQATGPLPALPQQAWPENGEVGGAPADDVGDGGDGSGGGGGKGSNPLPVCIRTTYRLNVLKSIPKKPLPPPGAKAGKPEGEAEGTDAPKLSKAQARAARKKAKKEAKALREAKAKGGGAGAAAVLAGPDHARPGAPPPGLSFPPIVVRAATSDGREVEVAIGEFSRRVEDVKDEIYDAVFPLTLPTRNHRLVWDGKLLDEEKLLDDYPGMKSGDTVRVADDVVNFPKQQPLGNVQGVDIFECHSWPEKQPLFVLVQRAAVGQPAWYWAKVQRVAWEGWGIARRLRAKVLFHGYPEEMGAMVDLESEGTMRLCMPKRSLGTGDGAADHWGQWQETSLEAAGVLGDPALQVEAMLGFADRQKGHLFKAHDRVRVHAMDLEEFSGGFEDLQLLPVGEVQRADPEHDATVVKVLNLDNDIVCHLPSAQLEFIAPSVYAREAKDIMAARMRHRDFRASMARQRAPVTVVDWQGVFIGGQHVILRVVDHGTEYRIHAQSLEHRRDYACAFGAMDLRVIGRPQLPSPILPQEATLEWTPLAERAPLLEMMVEYTHVEAGRLCVDLHACTEHGRRRKPLWNGGRWVEAPSLARAVSGAFDEHDAEVNRQGSFGNSAARKEDLRKSKTVFAHALTRMRRSQKQARRCLVSVREEHAAWFRRAPSLVGDTSVLVIMVHDPVSRERAVLSLGLSSWRHLGYVALHDLNSGEKEALAGLLVQELELHLPLPQAKLLGGRRGDMMVQSMHDKPVQAAAREATLKAGKAGNLLKNANGGGAMALAAAGAPPPPPHPDHENPSAPDAHAGADDEHHSKAAAEAQRHQLHLPTLPGEVRTAGAKAHHHLRVSFEPPVSMRRGGGFKPLWKGTLRVCERRLVLAVHGDGGGVVIRGFDRFSGRAFDLPVAFHAWQWMGHGPLPWLSRAERATLCWKLLRRLSVEDATLRVDMTPDSQWWLGIGTPVPPAPLWQGGIIYHGTVFLVRVCAGLTVGAPERGKAMAEKESRVMREQVHSAEAAVGLIDAHESGGGGGGRQKKSKSRRRSSVSGQGDGSAAQAGLVRKPWQPVKMQHMVPCALHHDGRDDILFTCRLFDVREQRTFNIGIPFGAASEKVRRFGYQAYEWMLHDEKVKLGKHVAKLAAFTKEQARAAAFLLARAKRALEHCAAQDDAYTWLVWRGRRAIVFLDKKAECLAWLQALGKKVEANQWRLNEAYYFLKRLRAHVWAREAAALFLSQCGAHALDWTGGIDAATGRGLPADEDDDDEDKPKSLVWLSGRRNGKWAPMVGDGNVGGSGGKYLLLGSSQDCYGMEVAQRVSPIPAWWTPAEVAARRATRARRLRIPLAQLPPNPDPFTDKNALGLPPGVGTVALLHSRRQHFCGAAAKDAAAAGYDSDMDVAERAEAAARAAGTPNIGGVVAAVHVSAALFAALRWLRTRAHKAMEHARRQDRAAAFLLGAGLKSVRTVLARHQTRRFLMLDGCKAVIICTARATSALALRYGLALRKAFVLSHREGQRSARSWLCVRGARALAHKRAVDEAASYLRGAAADAIAYRSLQHRCAVMLERAIRGRAAREKLFEMMSTRWEKRVDAEKGRTFFYDVLTGESRWEAPLVLHGKELLTNKDLKRRRRRRQNKALFHRLPPKGPAEAAQRIQGMWRCRKARNDMRLALAARWQKLYDKATDEYYYYNVRTGEARWEKPELLGDDCDLDETPLWERRWFVVERGVLTHYVQRFDEGCEETEVVERIKLRRIKRVVCRPDGEFVLVTKFKEHSFRAASIENQSLWAESIAKNLDLQLVRTTSTLLKVKIIQAEGIKNADAFGLSDPYAKVSVMPFSVGKGQHHTTKTVKDSLHPVWKEQFTFFVTGNVRGEGNVQIELFDEDIGAKDDPLGHCHIPLTGMEIGELKDVTMWMPIEGGKGRIQVNLCMVGTDEPFEELADDEDDSGSDDDGGATGGFRWPAPLRKFFKKR